MILEMIIYLSVPSVACIIAYTQRPFDLQDTGSNPTSTPLLLISMAKGIPVLVRCSGGSNN